MKKKDVKYPFMIEADSLRGITSFPSHTHGLADVGLPEFIMDPYAFGGNGNATRINSAYDFFKKQENDGYLKSILDGEVVKIRGKQLSPKYLKNDPYTYCFRKVTPEFEAVKLAYFEEEITDGMQFIQIWVDGDDYVLTDDYYRGGVRW